MRLSSEEEIDQASENEPDDEIYTSHDSESEFEQNDEDYENFDSGESTIWRYKQGNNRRFENSPFEITKRLCTPLFGSGRNVTMDNWYKSYPLAKELLSKRLTIVGTLKRNKAEIPIDFMQTIFHIRISKEHDTPLSQLNVETTEEEIDLEVQEPVEVFMDYVESLDVSSIGDQVTISEHAIKTLEEKTDIQESVGLCNETDNNDYPIAGPSTFLECSFLVAEGRWYILKRSLIRQTSMTREKKRISEEEKLKRRREQKKESMRRAREKLRQVPEKHEE
ncbi:hypothetical protein AVEN_59586-1 [Araneus ventricosus]|uniref:PiggyBac transposable element-derived protein domain-containing protein n=1 Tax=Araneus ventricosus TaxID=182803 RepID=A0A4Y2RPR2_ARAVE|nr:hypothetical protein AVEN_59586-1 [Araneus ventricosus]